MNGRQDGDPAAETAVELDKHSDPVHGKNSAIAWEIPYWHA